MLHFEPHTFLILIGLLPFLVSFFTKKINRKFAMIIAISSIAGFIADLITHIH